MLEEIAEELRARAGGLPDSLGSEEEAALRDMARAEVRRIRADGRRHRLPRFVPVRAAVAAAVLITAAASIFFYSRTRPPDIDRGARTGIRLIEPEGTLQRAPSIFRWKAVRNADIYQFEIFDEELRSVLVRRIKSTSVTLSPEEMSRLRPGQTYYWDVEAFDDENRPIASGQRSFLVPSGGTPDAPSAPQQARTKGSR